MPAALVLAAGSGQRMGGPKALLVVDGTALVARHVARFRELGCAPIVIVTRPELEHAVRTLAGDAHIVAAATSSQAESLQAGVAAVRAELVYVTPVDLIPPRLETLEALLDALDDGFDAVTPVHASHGGHPVLIRTASLAADGVTALRTRLEALGARRRRLVVDDPAVLVDLDEPRDLSARAPTPSQPR